jgi:hypothetical protein
VCAPDVPAQLNITYRTLGIKDIRAVNQPPKVESH